MLLEAPGGNSTLENHMRLYQSGNSDALEYLVREVSPRLRAIFREANLDTEELIQETWFQVHRSRHTWRPGEMLLPWIYSIARHVRSRSYRKAARRNEIALDEHFSIPPPELSFEFEQLLAELPASQREVLILMKVEGRSLAEVAATTGTSIGAVKQKVHRAYEKLRQILGGDF